MKHVQEVQQLFACVKQSEGDLSTRKANAGDAGEHLQVMDSGRLGVL